MPPPDYSLSDVEVYTKAAWDMIRNLPYLDVLNGIEPPDIRTFEDLPSWVPDFRLPVPGSSLSSTLGAMNNGAAKYNASRMRSPRSSFRITGQKELVLRGVKFDTIAYLGPSLFHQRHFMVKMEGFLEILLTRTPAPRESIVEALCRTLVANIFTPAAAADASATSTWWRTWWVEMLVQRRRHLDGEQSGSGAIIMDLMQQLGDRGSWFPPLDEVRDAMADDNHHRPAPAAVDFDFIIHRVWPHRVFFITQEGRFGIGTHSLREGDEIWLLEGGRTPFILRDNYMIGEAYVHGIMYGEAMTPEVVARVGPITIL